jgi:valyl-tRNA synthetase
LRLRQTANVQRQVAMQFARRDWSRPHNQGCQMVEDWLATRPRWNMHFIPTYSSAGSNRNSGRAQVLRHQQDRPASHRAT